MGKDTAISWTQDTWNPWQGCAKVSPGCAHCYMFRDKERFGQDPTVVVRSKPATFLAPLKEKSPRIIFTCSWSDFFHVDADPWREEAWDVIRRTPHHIYQVLTKRPERIADHLPSDWGKRGYPNVWLGTSVENQRWASRIPLLLSVPAAVHWISAEPLLGPLDLTTVYRDAMDETHGVPVLLAGGGLDWVVVGGESGKEHRPMNLDWARTLRDQCVRAGVAFHFKQVGGNRPKDGGRLLDGREWNEMPVTLTPTRSPV